jgi:hypothetical protein
MRPVKTDTVGILDLGGASAQIVFDSKRGYVAKYDLLKLLSDKNW